MKIGVLGSGFIGGELGVLWAQRGHSILFGSREHGSQKMRHLLARASGTVSVPLQEAVVSAEVILLALPYEAQAQTLANLSGYEGKVVIDASNKFPPGATSGAQDIAALWPRARVVKAFNTVGGENYGSAVRDGIAASMLIAGDDAEAKAVVSSLAGELGFDPVDVGGLSQAAALEQLAGVWVRLSRSLGRGFVWKVLR